MSGINKQTSNKLNMVWILLIVFVPLLDLFIGVDLADVGFSMSQYRFCMEDISSIYLPLFLSDVFGWGLLQICNLIGMPGYLGMELAWALANYYLCFISYRIYKRYRDDKMILPALALAMILLRTNFPFFIYNTSVALMALTALYFLIRGMNDRKPIFLSFASFFLVMASLCKISSLLQFAVFAVMFYELYQTRNWKYFGRQLLYVMIGFLVGLAFAAVLLGATCGVGEYIQMIIDMFFYASSSTDGHSIGNMIMINVKGAVRGAIFVAAMAVLVFLLKKTGRAWRAVSATLGVAVVLFVLGKLAGLDALPVLGSVYGMVFDFYNALSVPVALIYICLVDILRKDKYSDEYKMLVLASAMLTVLMPIGSNVGITHVCNEFFFALPYIILWVRDLAEEERAALNMYETKRPIVQVAAIVITWIVLLGGYQCFNKSLSYGDLLADMVPYENVEELRYMKGDRYSVEQLEELMAFLQPYEDDSEISLTTVGGIPLVNYLTGLRPTVKGCGAWIETEYVSAQEISEQLYAAEQPVIVVAKRAAIDAGAEKTLAVMNYVTEKSYIEAFVNEEYVVYSPRDMVKEN